MGLKSGLRQGELIGIQWADLDLQRGTLRVNRTIWRGKEGLPKGGRERAVDLPASAVDALKAHRHLRGLQELMGHATIEMTERYAHLSPDTRREAVNVLDRPLAPGCDIQATRLEAASNHP